MVILIARVGAVGREIERAQVSCRFGGWCCWWWWLRARRPRETRSDWEFGARCARRGCWRRRARRIRRERPRRRRRLRRDGERTLRYRRRRGSQVRVEKRVRVVFDEGAEFGDVSATRARGERKSAPSLAYMQSSETHRSSLATTSQLVRSQHRSTQAGGERQKDGASPFVHSQDLLPRSFPRRQVRHQVGTDHLGPRSRSCRGGEYTHQSCAIHNQRERDGP